MPNSRSATRAVALTLAAVLATLAGVASAADRYWPPIVDPATHQYTPGRWVWGDLVTSDVAVAAEFYAKVFGWTYETYGGEDDRDTYTLVLANGLPIGGMVFDTRAVKDGKPSARWVALVSVPDVQAAATAVEAHGGRIIVPPKMLGERGETAVLQDPEGAVFGALRSRNGDPADYAGDINEWVWLDLWTSDVARATSFYRAVAGYDVQPLPAGSTRDGAHLASGGYVRAGVMQKRDAKETSLWLPYVRVADAQAAVARARAGGGRVLREPVTVGRAIAAVIADPTGAPIGIVQLPDRETQP